VKHGILPSAYQNDKDGQTLVNRLKIIFQIKEQSTEPEVEERSLKLTPPSDCTLSQEEQDTLI
jgi:hypothetical protein